ncbi:hypothetical protein PQI07_27965 [Methylobacterium sp. 092160098-2]|uniref:ImmA/IrrE family metallo-endopeptidase n=1 Tax=Methylobacterium sp. 092160098-2 TaxID=3025129 RepID=UPI00238197EE|nr:hypothetical protein [Methylobacterium sp. 092160098-2]MDE4914505.1 hypothetical protein [Methylobacterium sp. 092160098-2]
MMNSLRNVQDATPLGVDFAFASRLGMRMADELAHVRGRPVLPVFEKFGGGYIEVPSVFGRTGDCVLVKPGPGLYAEHAHSPALDVAALNEVLAEAVGHLFLHYPAARSRYGDVVAMGVPRFSRTECQGVARGEATAFMIGFLMPQAETVAAFDQGLDDDAVASRFGVTRRLVQARRHALKRYLAAA